MGKKHMGRMFRRGVAIDLSRDLFRDLSRRDALRLFGGTLASLGTGALLGCSKSDSGTRPADASAPRPPDAGIDQVYDYVVIGAGSAGCPLTARLIERTDASVLLMEAGGSHDLASIRDFTQAWMLTQPGSEVDWGYRSVPQPELGDKTQSYSAGKVLGGSSSINGMVWARGHRGDYDRWAEIGCEGWDYDSVLPSFKHLETAMGNAAFRGSAGPIQVSSILSAEWGLSQAVVEAAVALGHPLNEDYNGADSLGAGYTQLNVAGTLRQDAYSAFVAPLVGNPRLTVMSRTLAKRLVFDADRRIERVVVEQEGQERSIRVGREVILCTGTVNTPKLLMLSGIGAADELAAAGVPVIAELPGVGKNFHDHLISVAVKKLRQPEPAEHITTMDVSVFAGEAPSAVTGAPRFQVQSYYMRYGWGSYPSEALALGSIHLHPTSRGTVTLNPEDPQGAPIIDPRFLSTPEDLAFQLEGYKIIRAIINAPALSEWVEDEEHTPGPDVDTDEELIAALREHSEADFHAVGTCKMGTDDMAVVDPRLRLNQVSGVRIAGAPVMPYVPSGNTNAPSMMTGDRLGLLIADER